VNDTQRGAGRAVAVVDVDDGDTRGATAEARIHGRCAAGGDPVSNRGRHCYHHAGYQTSDDAHQSRVHPCHDDRDCGCLDVAQPFQQPPNTRDADVVPLGATLSVIAQRPHGFAAHWQVRRAGGKHGNRRRSPGRLEAAENGRMGQIAVIELRPLFRGQSLELGGIEPRHEQSLTSLQVHADDLGDLRRCLARGEHRFVEPNSPAPFKIEDHVRRFQLNPAETRCPSGSRRKKRNPAGRSLMKGRG